MHRLLPRFRIQRPCSGQLRSSLAHIPLTILTIACFACLQHCNPVNGRLFALPDATNSPFPATFTRGVLRSERPALVSQGLASMGKNAMNYLQGRLDKAKTVSGSTARIFSLRDDESFFLPVCLNCLSDRLVDIQVSKWPQTNDLWASCRTDRLECLLEGRAEVLIKKTGSPFEYNTKLKSGNCMYIPQGWQLHGEIEGSFISWYWLPLRKQQPSVECTNRVRKECESSKDEDSCEPVLKTATISSQDKLRYYILAALNKSRTVEGYESFLRKELNLTSEEVEDVGNVVQISNVAGQDSWDKEEEEEIAMGTEEWLEENVDDDKLREYYQMTPSKTCSYSFSRGSVLFNEEEASDLSGKEKTGALQLLNFSSPQNLVRLVQGFPSAQEFFEDSSLPEKPVIMKGAARSFPAYRCWTFGYLAKQYGRNDGQSDEDKTMAAFFKNSAGGAGEKRVLSGILPSRWWGDVGLPPNLCCGGFQRRLLYPQVLLAVLPKTGTPDKHLSFGFQPYDQLSCNLRGYTVYTIVDKAESLKITVDNIKDHLSYVDLNDINLEKYPAMRSITRWQEVEVEPGDCVYIPNRWFRQVMVHSSAVVVDFLWNHLSNFSEVGCSDVQKTEATSGGVCNFRPDMLEQAEEYRYHMMDEMQSEVLHSSKDMLAILEREDHSYGDPVDAEILFTAADTNSDGTVTFDEMLNLNNDVIVDILGEDDDPARMASRGLETTVRSSSDGDGETKARQTATEQTQEEDKEDKKDDRIRYTDEL